MSVLFDELTAAVLLPDRRPHLGEVLELVPDCDCLAGEHVVATDVGDLHFSSAESWIEYMFRNAGQDAQLGWSCSFGYIALDFCTDGALIVCWSEVNISLQDALTALEEITAKVSAHQGYISQGGWLPVTTEEFFMGFHGETLYRIGAGNE